MAATLKEVAKKAGVSITTVSFVLNKRHQARAISPATCERVRKVASELQYSPNQLAKSLRTQKTMTIGILNGHWIDSHLGRLIEGVNTACSEAGYRSILASVGENDDPEDTVRNLLNSSSVDAIVIIDRGMDFTREFIESIASDRRPVILVGKRLNNLPCPCVCDDFLSYGYEGTQHLLAKGTTDIAYIGFDNENSAELLKGVMQAYEEAGVPWSNDQFLKIPYVDHLSMRHHTREFLSSAWPNKASVPEALYILKDQLLYGAMNVLRQLNVSIPEDTSIIGYGDMDIVYNVLSPHISTVLTAPNHLGVKAAEIVIQELKGKPSASPNELVALGGRLCWR